MSEDLVQETVISRLEAAVALAERERDQALIALDEAHRQITTLREDRGKIQGTLAGVSLAGFGLVIIAVTAVAGLISLARNILP